MKHKPVLIGGALAATLLFVIFYLPSTSLQTPKVTIEEIIESADSVNASAPANSKVVTGNVKYDLTLNFDDGTKKVFSESVSIGNLPLQSITAGGKKVKTIGE